MREITLVPKLFNIAVLSFSPLEELLLDARAFAMEEVFYGSSSLFVFFCILKLFECT